MRIALMLASCLLITGCSMNSSMARPAGAEKVNPSSIAANPAAFDGKDVEVTGMLVWEGERLGLYQSYGAYCRGSEKTAIYVDWRKWPGVSTRDNRREVVIRGHFSNAPPIASAAHLLSNGAPGPGPLEPGLVVGWLSAPEKPCPKALT